MENAQKIDVKRGLTLVEVLVVMAIIVLITAVSLPVYNKIRLRAMVVKTRTVIASIEAALSVYGSDFGDYPSSGGVSGSRVLAELLQGPVNSGRWRGPYMRFKQEDIDGDKNILDAWKRPLFYVYPQNVYDNVPYLIFSAGYDGLPDTENDIGNW